MHFEIDSIKFEFDIVKLEINSIEKLIFSPDGMRLLAIVNVDRISSEIAIIWNVKTGSQIEQS